MQQQYLNIFYKVFVLFLQRGRRIRAIFPFHLAAKHCWRSSCSIWKSYTFKPYFLLLHNTTLNLRHVKRGSKEKHSILSLNCQFCSFLKKNKAKYSICNTGICTYRDFGLAAYDGQQGAVEDKRGGQEDQGQQEGDDGHTTRQICKNNSRDVKTQSFTVIGFFILLIFLKLLCTVAWLFRMILAF